MPRKLLTLAFVLAVVGAACAQPPEAQIDLGSGVRFVPVVVDSLGDAGPYASVAVGPDGLPVLAYFGFEEELKEDEVAPTRPIGAPSLPGVMLASVSPDGYWTRGAIAIAEQMANVTVAFNPAFEPTVADLTPQNVTGLRLATAGDTYHAAWASAMGVFYATGSLDPATTTQATVSQVSSAPGLGLSLTLDEGGNPWLAYYTSTSSAGSTQVATPEGDGWAVESIGPAALCEGCATGIVVSGGGPAVAHVIGDGGVALATADGENGWSSIQVAETGGQGLSAVATADGVEIAYYDGATVALTTVPASGSAATVAVAEVPDGSADVDGARTALAQDATGALFVSWVDGATGVILAARAGATIEPVDTGGAGLDGAFPALAAGADPAIVYMGWYDADAQDALVGGYGDIGDVPFAAPSPTPTTPIGTAAPPPSQECTPVEGGVVTVVAEGIAYTEGSCIEVVAGESFTITFDNRDAGTQHNIQISNDPEPTSDLLFEGEIITGPAQIDYEIPAFDSAGEYAFVCVVHPNMIGSVQVLETGAGTGTGGGGGSSALQVSAVNLAFDTSTIELTAGEPTTLTFVNEDSGVQHNIAIYEDDTLAVELFNGELITGPTEIEYEIPALDAGTYYFLCIVHPTMNGSVVVT